RCGKRGKGERSAHVSLHHTAWPTRRSGSPSQSTVNGHRPPENADDDGVEDERAAVPSPERCEVLVSAIAGVLASTLREHDERVAIIVRLHDGDVAATDRLNGEFQSGKKIGRTKYHLKARIFSIRKRISTTNMLIKSIHQHIDNFDIIICTGASSGSIYNYNIFAPSLPYSKLTQATGNKTG
ncbi:hypothetical protein ACJX0J_005933, partial [Zea mays]